VARLVSDMNDFRCEECRGCYACVELFYEKEMSLPEKTVDSEKELVSRLEVLERVNSQLESDVASLRISLESLLSSLGSSLSISLGSSLGSSLSSSPSSSPESSSENEVAEVGRKKRRRRRRRRKVRCHTDTTSRGVQTEEEYIPALPVEVGESVSCRPEEQPLAGPWVSQEVVHQSAVPSVPAIENGEFAINSREVISVEELSPTLLVKRTPLSQISDEPEFTMDFAQQEEFQATDASQACNPVCALKSGLVAVVCFWVKVAILIVGFGSIAVSSFAVVTVQGLTSLERVVTKRPRTRASSRSQIHQLRQVRLEDELERAMVSVLGRGIIDTNC